jgi:hypothetical protein
VAYKPGDFFLGVIDFFGILVPGAILMYLHGDRLLVLLGGQPILDGQVSRWVALSGPMSSGSSYSVPPYHWIAS